MTGFGAWSKLVPKRAGNPDTSGCGFGYKGVPVPLTMSFGVTACMPEDAAPELLERADATLYAAKRAGRNRVAIG